MKEKKRITIEIVQQYKDLRVKPAFNQYVYVDCDQIKLDPPSFLFLIEKRKLLETIRNMTGFNCASMIGTMTFLSTIQKWSANYFGEEYIYGFWKIWDGVDNYLLPQNPGSEEYKNGLYDARVLKEAVIKEFNIVLPQEHYSIDKILS